MLLPIFLITEAAALVMAVGVHCLLGSDWLDWMGR